MRIPNIEGINAVGEETSINPHIPIRISDTELIIFDQLHDSLSVEEFTLFMIEEANLWDTEDLIYFNDLYENTNEYEVSL